MGDQKGNREGKPPFIFFGGKGGTGKTTCSAAYAARLAKEGRKTLLVSTDPAHSLSDIVGTALSDKILPIRENLWGIEIDAAKEAKRYIAEIQDKMLAIVSPAIVEEIKRQMEIAYLSPGSEEAATFDKFVELMDELGNPYEAIVFDTAPTGHTLRLLSLPEILGTWIESLIAKRRKSLELFKMAGRFEKDLMKRAMEDPVIESLTRRQKRFEKSRTYLTDPKSSAFFFVLNAERMPILETERAIELLEKFGIPIGGVVVNRVIPPEAGDFFAARLAAQEEYLQDIRRRFGAKKIVHLPLLRSDVQGMEQVDAVAALMGDIMGEIDEAE
ncbi:MAG: ArsA family ATPase [Synergistaceae bacterium]|jgi:arsenite-transporting ATPase|nr:ArsA family ATPase [Synergistaceae bacterium]